MTHRKGTAVDVKNVADMSLEQRDRALCDLLNSELDVYKRQVFQGFNLFNNMDVLANCTLAPITRKKMSKAEAEEVALGHRCV